LEGSSSSSNDGLKTNQASYDNDSVKTNLDEKRPSKSETHPFNRSDTVRGDLGEKHVPPTTAEGFRWTFLVLFAEPETYWRLSFPKRYRKILERIPANSAAARAGPLSASMSANRVWTSANLKEASSLASTKRLSSPSSSSSASFAFRAISS
jgi:hypothetical protein